MLDNLDKVYTIVYFLFWETVSNGEVRSIGADKKQKYANLLIVDGQQRLTSLYAVIKGKEVVRKDYQKERIIIAFNPIDETFVVPDAATCRSSIYFHDIS